MMLSSAMLLLAETLALKENDFGKALDIAGECVKTVARAFNQSADGHQN